MMSSSINFREAPYAAKENFLIQVFGEIEERICCIHSSEGIATGFFISKNGMLVTVSHIHEGINLQEVNPRDIEIYYQGKKYPVIFSPGFQKTIERRTDVDLCLLQIDTPIETPCFSLTERDVSHLRSGESVYFGGFALGREEPLFHSGTISSRASENQGIHHFIIDGTILKGVSGGPIVQINNDRIEVIGCIFEACVMADETYFNAKNIIEELVLHPDFCLPFKLISKDLKGTKIKEHSSMIRQLLFLHQFHINNLSTNLGKVIHAQHIIQMMNPNGIPSYSPKERETLSPKLDGLPTRVEKKINQSEISNLLTQQKEDADEHKNITKICEFIKQKARNKDAIDKANKQELEQITDLDLTGRELTELPNLSKLSNLIYLDLTSNLLESFPSQVNSLKNLEVLILAGNNLKSLPKNLSEELTSLNEIDILENPIREVPVSLRKLIREIPYMAKWVE